MGSYTEPGKMKILITGAGGFLGQALAKSLLEDDRVSQLLLTDVNEPAIPTTQSKTACQVTTRAANLTQPTAWRDIVSSSLTHVYLLHGIMSGAAEANLELGLTVNIDSIRLGLDTLRSVVPGVKVIFASSLAVFGQLPTGTVVDENTVTLPRSSYGAEKHIVETLLNDYSRRGLIDGRIVRLPTIVVRPGQPSGAASSFCSGIIREPLRGQESILPVDQSTRLWVCSTRTIVRNLLHAREVPPESFAGSSRIVNLPGITVTVSQMLEALEQTGGKNARQLVQFKHDPAVENIVGSWPALFDIRRALQLGFAEDGDISNAVREYMIDFGSQRIMP